MDRPHRQTIKHFPVFTSDRDFPLSGEIHNLTYPAGMSIPRNVNPLDRLASGNQRLKDSVNSKDPAVHTGHQRSLNDTKTRATASAAIASSLPITPSPSIVFAFTDTLSRGIEIASAIFSFISGKNGKSFGRSARMLESTLPIS